MGKVVMVVMVVEGGSDALSLCLFPVLCFDGRCTKTWRLAVLDLAT